jgi:hypothetical protein
MTEAGCLPRRTAREPKREKEKEQLLTRLASHVGHLTKRLPTIKTTISYRQIFQSYTS